MCIRDSLSLPELEDEETNKSKMMIISDPAPRVWEVIMSLSTKLFLNLRGPTDPLEAISMVTRVISSHFQPGYPGFLWDLKMIYMGTEVREGYPVSYRKKMFLDISMSALSRITTNIPVYFHLVINYEVIRSMTSKLFGNLREAPTDHQKVT